MKLLIILAFNIQTLQHLFYSQSKIMEAEHPFGEEPKQQSLNLRVDIRPVDNYYFFESKATLGQEAANFFVDKSFVLFILELRTGMNENSIRTLRNGILDFCEEALEKGINTFGFIINGEYYTIKNPTYISIKEILILNMKISEQDDYLLTLRKLRHVISHDLGKYDKNFDYIEMIFFTSFVEINHTLGVKKRSYIDKLNQHSEQCSREVKHIYKTLKKQAKSWNAHVIGLNKSGQRQQDYSMADNDLFSEVSTVLGSFKSLFLNYYIEGDSFKDYRSYSQNYVDSCNKMAEGFKRIAAVVLNTLLSLRVKIPTLAVNQKADRQRKLTIQNALDEKTWHDKFKEDFSSSDQQQDKMEQKPKQKLVEQEKQKLQQKQKMLKQLRRIARKNMQIFHMHSSDMKQFFMDEIVFIKRDIIDLNQLKNNGIQVQSKRIKDKLIQNKELTKQQQAQKLNLEKAYNFCKVTTSYTEPTLAQCIYYRTTLFNDELNRICQALKHEIIKNKRIYDGNGKSHIETYVNEEKQLYLKDRIFFIEKEAKQLYTQIFDPKTFIGQRNNNNNNLKRHAFQRYSGLKLKLDASQQVLMRIMKKQILNNDIGLICQAVTYWDVKKSLKNKLIRRVNLNPKMLDETYSKIENIIQKNNHYIDSNLDTNNKIAKHAIGNCIQSGANFATALKNSDCMAILIQVERPDAAIADPGRVRIRQVSPFSMTVNNFFRVFHYGIDTFGNLDQVKGGKLIRQQANLEKQNYQESWDYWNLVEKKYTVPALIPVYLCKEHWDVAKLLMKPCLGWTATGQPLGYTFSQIQNIPFMALSFSIRRVQQLKYQIQQIQTKLKQNKFQVLQYSSLQRKLLDKIKLLKRMQDICWVLEETCQQITKDISGPNFEEKFTDTIALKYKNYVEPINRTVDVICNNSAFLAQLYTIINLQVIKKPSEQEFAQFFKFLVEEELRRETDGWNQEESQDKFINKLLNSEIEQMQAPEYVVIGSQYFDKFETLQRGEFVHKTYFEIKRQQLQMMIKKDGKFNDVQRLTLIEYKRLYENRVLWMWYVRFRLYGPTERIKIHKWKSLDLHNSYNLFTMIIQNKKQRKNHKRRQAINSNQYVNPFDYYAARQFLQNQFLRLRAQKEKKNVQILNTQKFYNAAVTFSDTKSLQQAAGTLINAQTGSNIASFYHALSKGGANRVQLKLKMLLLGEFKGVQLCKGWKMSKKKLRRLEEVYPYQFSRYRYMI